GGPKAHARLFESNLVSGFPERWHLLAEDLVCPKSEKNKKNKKNDFTTPKFVLYFSSQKKWLQGEDGYWGLAKAGIQSFMAAVVITAGAWSNSSLGAEAVCNRRRPRNGYSGWGSLRPEKSKVSTTAKGNEGISTILAP
ncbi:MAG: hypothetical protein QME44_10950, partial [Thermodesulfobacteriota bacterium]|nr:hypothetical protein [Thermodesulfobacteriota bacterium]